MERRCRLVKKAVAYSALIDDNALDEKGKYTRTSYTLRSTFRVAITPQRLKQNVIDKQFKTTESTVTHAHTFDRDTSCCCIHSFVLVSSQLKYVTRDVVVHAGLRSDQPPIELVTGEAGIANIKRLQVTPST
jgi:hypothetical protein